MDKKRIARLSGLSSHIHKIYYKFNSALAPNIYENLQDIDFPDIDNSQYEKIVLFPLFHSDQYMTTLCTLIAHNLKSRGFGSLFLFDNMCYESCKGNPDLPEHTDNCVACVNRSTEIASLTGVPTKFFNSNRNSSVPESIKDQLEGFVEASVINNLKIADIDHNNAEEQRLIRKFSETAYNVWNFIESLDDRYEFDHIVSSGSPYIPRGVGILYGKENQIPISAFGDPNKGRSGKSLRFGKMDGPLTQHISDRAWEKIKKSGLNSEQEAEIDNYLDNRFSGNRYTQYTTSESHLLQDMSDRNTDIYSLYTHLPWDAAVVGDSSVFADQYEWIFTTIDAIEGHEEKELVIKTHPAEKIIGTNEGTSDVISNELNSIPDNLTILQPDTRINPYDLVNISSSVLAYNSTIGMESVYLGTPVVVPIDSHYSQKGFTRDISSNVQYTEMLQQQNPDESVAKAERKLAKVYMYNYFIDRPILVDLFHPNSGPGYDMSKFNTYGQIKAGEDTVIDDVGKAIVENNDYFYTKSHS